MNKNVQTITRTGLALALVVALQFLSSMALGSLPPLAKQLVTGTLVNMMLALAVSLIGVWSGAAVGVLSAVMATLLGIGPLFPALTPVIALSNAVYVLILAFFFARWQSPAMGLAGVAAAAAGKCALLWGVVPLVLAAIPEAKPPQIAMMTLMFSWPQGITALGGGILCLMLAPTLKKAVK